MKNDKTNVMRLLDEWGIEYEHFAYNPELVNAVEVAKACKQEPEAVFKTLVTVGKTGEHYVFMIPSNGELDLKKAAKIAGEKAIEMIPQKQLLPLTGYIHGGCSPIGMKKQFKTVFHETAYNFETIIFSGGKIGYQIEMKLNDMSKIFKYTLSDIIVK